MDFMFKGLKHLSKGLGQVFKGFEHKFKALEHKKCRGRKYFPLGGKLFLLGGKLNVCWGFAVAVFCWRYAKHLAEALAEIPCCLESYCQGNLVDRHVGLLQEGSGMFQAHIAQKFVWRDAKHLLGLLV